MVMLVSGIGFFSGYLENPLILLWIILSHAHIFCVMGCIWYRFPVAGRLLPGVCDCKQGYNQPGMTSSCTASTQADINLTIRWYRTDWPT